MAVLSPPWAGAIAGRAPASPAEATVAARSRTMRRFIFEACRYGVVGVVVVAVVSVVVGVVVVISVVVVSVVVGVVGVEEGVVWPEPEFVPGLCPVWLLLNGASCSCFARCLVSAGRPVGTAANCCTAPAS